jgi:hypothetical protein
MEVGEFLEGSMDMDPSTPLRSEAAHMASKRRQEGVGRLGKVVDDLCRVLRRRLALNYVLWYWFLIYQGWLAYLLLGGIGGIAADYRLWIWVAGMLNGAILTLGLAWVDSLVEGSNHGWVKWLWGGCVGALAAAYFADLCLYRMMAIHLPTGLRLLLGNGWRQCLLTVEASGVRATHLRQFASFGTCAFLCGMVITRATWWLSMRYPIQISFRCLAGTAAALVATLTIWELRTQRDNPWAKSWEEVHRLMPFAIDPLHHVNGRSLRVGPLRPPRSMGRHEGTVAQAQFPAQRVPGSRGSEMGAPSQRRPPSTDTTSLSVNQGQAVTATDAEFRNPLPDVFVFVLESVRGDYLTQENAPHLARFSADCLKFRDSIASGNATQMSWFSLLTADEPLYFAMMAHRPHLWGSIPLRLLRDTGYEIHVLSSTYLNYNDIDRIAFGPGLELVNSVFDARQMTGMERPDRDRETTQRLLRALPEKRGGRIFFVFYDSTHHDYYWPSDYPAPFQPFATEWKYFDFNTSPAQLPGIKNRYRNALHFIDSLFGTFMKQMKATGRYEDAVVFAVGDHGEEFLEHGKFVHASELWREQIHIPFLLKLPTGVRPEGLETLSKLTASHVDFLPILLDCLRIPLVTNLFDGQSLFRKRSDFVVTAADNGGRDPYRFCLSGGELKAWLQYRPRPTLTALERNIYLTRLTDTADRSVGVDVKSPEAMKLLEGAFGDALSRLYPTWAAHEEASALRSAGQGKRDKQKANQ